MHFGYINDYPVIANLIANHPLFFQVRTFFSITLLVGIMILQQQLIIMTKEH